MARFDLYNGAVALDFDERKHVYRVDGTPVPSVTRALDVIAKPALVPWAAKCAAEFVAAELRPGVALDEVEIRDLAERAKRAHRDVSRRAAGIGSAVHSWAERHARGEEPEPPVNPMIRSGTDAYKAWLAAHDVRAVAVERRCYSRTHRYAGTVDLVAYIDGVAAVADFKTSSALHDEYALQLAAYQQALMEEQFVGADVDRWLIRFDKHDGSFEAVKLPRENYERDARAFRAALALMRTLDEMRAAKKAA